MLHEEEWSSHYHNRSNVETTFSMVKGKFGNSVRSNSETGQMNEILLKFLCHNICVLIQEMHELGIQVELRGVVKRVYSRSSLPGVGRRPGMTLSSWHNGSLSRATA